MSSTTRMEPPPLPAEKGDGNEIAHGVSLDTAAASERRTRPRIETHQVFRVVAKSPGSLKRAHVDVDMALPLDVGAVTRHHMEHVDHAKKEITIQLQDSAMGYGDFF